MKQANFSFIQARGRGREAEKRLLCRQPASLTFIHLWGSRVGRRHFSAFHTSSSFSLDTAKAFATCSQTFRLTASVSITRPRSLAPSPDATPSPGGHKPRSHPGQTGRCPRANSERPHVVQDLRPAGAFARPGSPGTTAPAERRAGVRVRPLQTGHLPRPGRPHRYPPAAMGPNPR